jgi:hypothetical protein
VGVWARRRRQAIIRDFLSSSSEDEEDREEGVASWKEDVNRNEILDGSYDKEKKKQLREE